MLSTPSTRSKIARRPLRLVAMFAAVAILIGGCATAPKNDPEALAEFKLANDPIEPFNRAMFDVNLTLDRYILKPAAQAYVWAIPEFGRNGIHNLLANLRSPIVFINDVLQGEPDRAGDTLARMVANTLFGLGGLIDVATEIGIPAHSEDFGQTFAVWGINSGPYLVLPILGPSNPRDFAGLAIEWVADPVNLVLSNEKGLDAEWAVTVRSLVSGVDMRSRNLDTLDQIERTSLDFYAAIRSLYRQRRLDEIKNGKPTSVVPAPGISTSPDSGPRGGTAELVE